MAEPNLIVQNIGGVVVVNLGGSALLDMPTIDLLGQRLYELVDAQAQRKIVLDFSKVRLLSSSLLGVLVKLQRKAKDIGGRVVICGLRPELQKAFKITRMDKLFEFHATEEPALNSFGVFTNP
jgi:anti-sigma B factor antagonist